MDLNDASKWQIVDTVPAEHSHNFWRAVLLSVIKPHVINRRLAGAEPIAALRTSAIHLNLDGQFIRRIAHIVQSRTQDEIGAEFLAHILNESEVRNEFVDVDAHSLFDLDFNSEKQIVVILNKLLPKNLSTHKHTFEIAILGKGSIYWDKLEDTE